MHGCKIALLLCSAISLAMGQMPDRTAGKGEFPALQLLPPGSVVKGISLPRYEKHRVSALIMADELEIISRQVVKLKGIVTALYGENDETTTVRLTAAEYHFGTALMSSEGKVSLSNPRLTAQGEAVYFNSDRQQGMLRGPVITTLNTDALSHPKK